MNCTCGSEHCQICSRDGSTRKVCPNCRTVGDVINHNQEDVAICWTCNTILDADLFPTVAELPLFRYGIWWAGTSTSPCGWMEESPFSKKFRTFANVHYKNRKGKYAKVEYIIGYEPDNKMWMNSYRVKFRHFEEAKKYLAVHLNEDAWEWYAYEFKSFDGTERLKMKCRI